MTRSVVAAHGKNELICIFSPSIPFVLNFSPCPTQPVRRDAIHRVRRQPHTPFDAHQNRIDSLFFLPQSHFFSTFFYYSLSAFASLRLCVLFRVFLSPAPISAIRYNELMAIKITPDQEIWVMTTEGSKITGYNRQYLEQLARKNLSLPEDERLLKVRMRARRYELWLPDLLRYIEEIGNGPHQDKK